MINKLIIGTAQLGLNYGINNISGKPRVSQSLDIINNAKNNRIYYFDTAPAYGNSENILGNFNDINVFTKISKIDNIDFTEENVIKLIEKSLKNLNCTSIYCIYLHSFENYTKQNIEILRKIDCIKNIGVSIYTPEEAKQVLNDKLVDYLQIPFNMIDTRWITNEMLELYNNTNIKIVIRSVYLQGLLIKPENYLNKFCSINMEKHILEKIDELLNNTKFSLKELCMYYVLSQSWVDSIILGLETSEQLIENINLFNKFKKLDINHIILSYFSDIPEILLDPRKW